MFALDTKIEISDQVLNFVRLQSGNGCTDLSTPFSYVASTVKVMIGGPRQMAASPLRFLGS
jgi:hypothetical protein